MKQIRCGTFETNSSSTHSMVIAMADEFDKWQNGTAYVNYNGELFSKEEALEMYKEAKDGDEDFISFDEWINTWDSELWDYDSWRDDLEHDVNTFTTPSGETIKMICAYGTDY